jgi:hemoglobin-like flavoprotein
LIHYNAKILRGPFNDDAAVIIQLQLSHIKREHRLGQVTESVYSVERTRLIKAILEMLKEWDGTDD